MPLYVSSVEGHLVPRFSTASTANPIYIGATRDFKTVTWDTNLVVIIPDAEWREYRREYRRALNDKALKERTEAAWKAQLKRAAQAAEAAVTEVAAVDDTRAEG